jgi:CheY-like chemotaxis protein
MGKKKKIMVVDDDKDFLEEVSDMLNGAGYETVTVSDNESVVSVAQEAKPDLILLDLKMPLMSGFEIAGMLKAAIGTSRVPIIATSGFYALKEREFLTTICGIDKFLKKPLSPPDLIKEIKLALK